MYLYDSKLNPIIYLLMVENDSKFNFFFLFEKLEQVKYFHYNSVWIVIMRVSSLWKFLMNILKKLFSNLNSLLFIIVMKSILSQIQKKKEDWKKRKKNPGILLFICWKKVICFLAFLFWDSFSRQARHSLSPHPKFLRRMFFRKQW